MRYNGLQFGESMKSWPDNHPKAKLMARKREAILLAATEAFLEQGYEGASMEGIAATAGVSVMTLYRHVKNKDDLFAAVVSGACALSDEAEAQEFQVILKRPFREILIFIGVLFQKRLTSPQSTALLRAVMVESGRFPNLAEMTYRGLVSNHLEMFKSFLATRPELHHLSNRKRHPLGVAFIDQLFGANIVRVLLGLDDIGANERRTRAEAAADRLLAALSPQAQ